MLIKTAQKQIIWLLCIQISVYATANSLSLLYCWLFEKVSNQKLSFHLVSIKKKKFYEIFLDGRVSHFENQIQCSHSKSYYNPIIHFIKLWQLTTIAFVRQFCYHVKNTRLSSKGKVQTLILMRNSVCFQSVARRVENAAITYLK